MKLWIPALGLMFVAGAVFYGQPRKADNAESALINQYCTGCHNQTAHAGGLALDGLDPADVGAHADTWEKVVRKVRAGMMPPSGMPRPARETLDDFAAALEARLDQHAAAHPEPGSVALHRLNRAEYANAIRDLLALEVDVSTMLPADDASDGFDNIAVALKVSPALMESYVSAAANISRLAVGDQGTGSSTELYRVPRGLSPDQHVEGLPLGTRGGMLVTHNFPLDAEYTLKFGAGGRRGLGASRPDSTEYLEVTLDGARLKRFELGRGPAELKTNIPAGPHQIGFAIVDGYRPGLQELWSSFGGGAGVSSLEIVGPSNATGPGDAPSRRKVFICHPDADSIEESACAKKILTNLATLAYRGSPTDEQIDTLMSFYESGRNSPTGARTFDAGIQRALARILADPQFVFRFEAEPADAAPGEIYSINDLELASRLSFFIWSSLPDQELLDVAAKGHLHNPEVLREQTLRMLADPRSHALVENFAGQWLGLRQVKNADPQTRGFTENIRQSMIRETEMFFESIIREDRSIRDLLDGDYTFLDETLARHYGIDGIHGSRFRRVELSENDPRRGLLGKGAIQLFTSVATRTSPVTRGKFVLENLIGVPAPLPPPNVPALEDAGGTGEIPGSVRAQMELHRQNPVCASCHKIMDPIGFSMENFDLIGRWRDMDGGQPVDATSVLVDGTPLDGVATLRAALLDRFDVFARTLTEKLLTYGLGRAVHSNDMPTVRNVVRQASEQDYRFSSLIVGIVQSEPFQTRRKAGSNPLAQN